MSNGTFVLALAAGAWFLAPVVAPAVPLARA